MRKISALLLVVVLALAAVLSACGSKGDVTPSPSPTVTPSPTATASPKPALIKNGNFEEAYDTAYPKTPKSWSIYGDSFDGKTAPLSFKDKENSYSVKRGIISVKEDVFEENKSKYGDISNPGKPEDASPDDDNIIMIYNEFPTAAKFKSLSISLPAGAFGKITVYVKTLDDIKPSDPDHPENYEFYGATIGLSGMEEPIIIAGIDTDEQWVKYEFYLEGSPSASKTLYVELGLGTGSPADSRGYTQGHAFFDAVSMDYISKVDFERALKELDQKGELSERFFFYDGDKESPNSYLVNRIDAKKKPGDWTYFAYSYINRDTIYTYTFEDLDLEEIDIDESLYYDTVDPTKFITENGFIEVGGEDLKGFDEELKNFPFSSQKVFYMKNDNPATQGFKTKDFVMKPFSPAYGNTGIQQAYSYYRITVYLKTSDFVSNGFNLLLVAKDASGEEYYSKFDNIDTAESNLTEEDLEKEANRHNKWANWMEYSFYVQANPYEDVTWHLELWLGPYDVRAKQINKFTRGHVLFAEMEVQRLTSTEYSSASSGDRVKTGLKFFQTKSPQIANSGFNTTTDNTGAIINRPVNPSSWDGRFGGYHTLKDGGSLVQNHNSGAVVSGIINQNYLDAYRTNNYIDDTLKYGDVDNISNFGAPNYLMIRNVAKTSYGYASQTKTLSTKSYYKFSVSVKTYGSATASIYIVDDKGKMLEVEGSGSAAFENFQTNGWETFVFFVKTGELTKTIRIELWNGARDSSEDKTSQGYVLFDDVVMGVSSQEIFDEAEAGAKLIKLDFEGVDVAPTQTPTPTPTPSPSQEPEPAEFKFPWDMLITGITALALIVAIVVIAIRKAKKSKLFRPRKVRVKEPSYSRNRLKIRERVVEEEPEKETEEEEEAEEAEQETEEEGQSEDEGQESSDEQSDNEGDNE